MHILVFSAALIVVAVIRVYLPSEEEVSGNPFLITGIVLVKIIFWLIQILLPFLVFYLILEALFEVIGRIL